MTIIAVAPMMDCTDRHDRYFLRLISPDVLLYTEMITAQALQYGDVNYLLGFDQKEKYLALQLGGADPKMLQNAACKGEAFGYDEINLNVGCPSSRVKSGNFGACLMLNPDLVAECIAAMRGAVTIPVTVKCRIGVDEQDSYEYLYNFIKTVAASGCDRFIIHARKAWLSGLSPKENREIPPLCYETVYRIKKDFPALTIIINGGIKTVDEISTHLQHVDGVMLGRAAYSNPYLLSAIQAQFFTNKMTLSRHEVLETFIPYIRKQLENGVRLTAITRHILGLFYGQHGAAKFRRYMSEHAHQKHAGVEVIQNVLSLMNETST